MSNPIKLYLYRIRTHCFNCTYYTKKRGFHECVLVDLTSASVCRNPFLNMLRDPDWYCPVGKFGKVTHG